MTDRDIIDTIADDFNNEIVGNSSDYNGGRLTLGRSRELAAQALAALRAAGYAIVRLPEPDAGWRDQWFDCRVHLDTTGEYVLHEPDIEDGSIVWLKPSEARETAAALLAAADKAEEDK